MLNFNISDTVKINICNTLKRRAMVGFGSGLVRPHIGQQPQNAETQAVTEHTAAEHGPSAVLKINNSGRHYFNKKRIGGLSHYSSM